MYFKKLHCGNLQTAPYTKMLMIMTTIAKTQKSLNSLQAFFMYNFHAVYYTVGKNAHHNF